MIAARSHEWVRAEEPAEERDRVRLARERRVDQFADWGGRVG